MKNIKNVPYYCFGFGAFKELGSILSIQGIDPQKVVYFVDQFFKNSELIQGLPIEGSHQLIFVDTKEEPSTAGIDLLTLQVRNSLPQVEGLIGIGGGITLDTTKAVSNLLNNPGRAEEYQGWDLLKKPGVFKIGIPTLSGTGSESSRTCVLSNKATGIKLGMNSDYTMFDQLILDPSLTQTVPRNQFFYTGMDTYLHAIEYLNGRDRSPLIDTLASQAVSLCREVFLSTDMMSEDNLEKMMIASLLGGSAAGNVGMVHPFSAGLSIVKDTHHGISNCIIMQAMKDYYPKEHDEFIEMKNRQSIELPSATQIVGNMSDDEFSKFIASSTCHNKPLTNALGPDFKTILSPEKVRSIFS